MTRHRKEGQLVSRVQLCSCRKVRGRISPLPPEPLSGDTYRPHLVTGDPAQRRQNNLPQPPPRRVDWDRLPPGPPAPQVGEMRTVLTLMYFPHPMYDQLRPGT